MSDEKGRMQAERPKAPGPTEQLLGQPSIEELLREAVTNPRPPQSEAVEKEARRAPPTFADALNGAIVKRALDAGYGGVGREHLTSGSLYEAATKQLVPPATGGCIVQRLSTLRTRLNDVADRATNIADALDGSREQPQTGTGLSDTGGLFALYARFLDEIDAIVDNIEREQARAREAIG